MDTLLSGLLTALWFGILTSISPCPLSTNIAAISFVGKELKGRRRILISGLFYVGGRMSAYLIISIIILGSLLSIPEIARFLQKYLNIVLGPLMVLVGIFLLDIIPLNFGRGKNYSDDFREKIRKRGFAGAFMLGFIFALSFCPVSAGLFFGSLMPLSIKYDSFILFPLLYGLGTALPVIIFAFAIAFAMNKIGQIFNTLTKFEKWFRKITAIVFIIAGLYLSYEFLL